MAKVEYEYEERDIPLDDKLPAVMEQLAKEGWVIAPGTVPIGKYKLVRSPAEQSGGLVSAALHIDESKVHILGPDGKIKQ